jgi:hypothetical protein
MFLHRSFHEYAWSSPDRKTHNKIDQILIDSKWHSSVLDVRFFRVADCDSDRCPVIASVRKLLAGSGSPAQTFDVERFNLRKLNELEVRKKYQIEISDRFAASENLNDNEGL